MGKKYILVQDDDCHWFVIPKFKEAEWGKWCESDSWDVPEWAEQVGGSPSLVSFERYTID